MVATSLEEALPQLRLRTWRTHSAIQELRVAPFRFLVWLVAGWVLAFPLSLTPLSMAWAAAGLLLAIHFARLRAVVLRTAAGSLDMVSELSVLHPAPGALAEADLLCTEQEAHAWEAQEWPWSPMRNTRRTEKGFWALLVLTSILLGWPRIPLAAVSPDGKLQVQITPTSLFDWLLSRECRIEVVEPWSFRREVIWRSDQGPRTGDWEFYNPRFILWHRDSRHFLCLLRHESIDYTVTALLSFEVKPDGSVAPAEGEEGWQREVVRDHLTRADVVTRERLRRAVDRSGAGNLLPSTSGLGPDE